MKNETDSLQKRQLLFQLVEETGNVTEACRILGVNKASYYNFKIPYELYGLDGLRGEKKENLIHLSSKKRKDKVIDKIAEYAIQYPEIGCHKLRNLLFEESFYMSANAIQNALKSKNLGSMIDRIHALEDKLFKEDKNPTEDQCELIEKKDPCMKERDFVCKAPGEVLVQCITCLYTSPPQNALFAHFVIDRYGCYAFLEFDRSESIDVSIRLLNDTVIPHYDEMGIQIKGILLETEEEPDAEILSKYGRFVESYGIFPRFIESSDEHADGFAQRFREDLIKRFLLDPGVDLRFTEIENINKRGQMWLDQYNSSPYRGYRNFGYSPYAVIKAFNSGKRLI